MECEMFAIFISACLIRDPAVCREFKIQIADQLTSATCVTEAPLHFGWWVTEHPAWRIARWRCGSVSENRT